MAPRVPRFSTLRYKIILPKTEALQKGCVGLVNQSQPESSRPLTDAPIGYCTNVHAGTDIDSILANLQRCAVQVREHLSTPTLGIGLWFSEQAAAELISPSPKQASVQKLAKFRDSLHEMGLIPYTLNGFPQQDFHQSVVKHRVYEPTWWQPERLHYTNLLVELLDAILPAQASGSISTLPIAWSHTDDSPGSISDDLLQLAAKQLLRLALDLHRRYEHSGRRIVIALEPEPGCLFTDHASLRAFYERYWSEPAVSAQDAEIARRYLRVCHDICHSAVMAEDQFEELEQNTQLGIRVGKVQVSSAIQIPWHALQPHERQLAIEQLQPFAEDRYLHQTLVLHHDGRKELFEDLPTLLRRVRNGDSHLCNCREWRIHFHVPIYADRWGPISTTRNEILRFLHCARVNPNWFDGFEHYEVETYAWSVLPPSLATASLPEGISEELRWLNSAIRSEGFRS
jgi:hypothetical protein